jgi:murein peptide amidase A
MIAVNSWVLILLGIPWTRQKRQDNHIITRQETFEPLVENIESFPNWATSAGGKAIPLYRSKNDGSPRQKPILFLGGTHGDEPEGVWLAEYTLKLLQKNSEGTHPWVLLPCLNPDGFDKNERVNASGVDLNRNFPDKNWSEFHTAPRYYPGKKPSSEPEVQALVKLIDEINPRIIIHCHSWKPCIVLTGDAEIETAKILSRHTGYEFMQDIGYPTPGSLGEYGWRQRNIPVICIEVEEKLARPEIEKLFHKAIEEIFIIGAIRR